MIVTVMSITILSIMIDPSSFARVGKEEGSIKYRGGWMRSSKLYIFIGISSFQTSFSALKVYVILTAW